MKPKQLAIIGLVPVLTCLYERDPTGLSDGHRTHGASQGGLLYAEERRAIELARVIPNLAGFVFDTSGNVVILLKGDGESPATKSLLRPRFGQELARGRRRNPAADLIVQTAMYTFLELKEWRDRLMDADILTMPGVVWLDLDEASNRVVIGLDLGADPAAVRTVAQDLAVPAEAVEFEVTGPYVPQQTLGDEFRPLEGGIQIQRVSGTSAATCTLAFTAAWQDQDVFLTAGHCSPDPTGADGVEQFQPTAPLTPSDSATITAIGREIAHVSEPCGNRQCSYSDAAIYELIADTVPPIPSEPWILGRVARPASGCFPGPCDPPVLNLGSSPYWVIDTTHESFVVNDLVSKIGSATGWSQGSVSKTCVNVSPAQGVTYYCQMYASYGQDDGDSGAPILLDIMLSPDSTVTLGGIHSGRAGKNAVFSPWSGIVQDYGSLSVVPSAQQPEWPLLTDRLPAWDTTRVVALPGDTFRIFRTDITLRFNPDVSDAAKAAFFNRHSMTVLGVTRSGRFFVRIPDPGTSVEALFQVLEQLRAEAEIAGAMWIPRSPMPETHDFRLPSDGPGQQRNDWSQNSASTWAMRAIRAPLAWGCETGMYAEPPVRLGIFEWKHQHAHPELARSAPQLWEPPDSLLAPLYQPAAPATVVANETHASATTGLLSAEGDNGSGIAGVNWRSRLYVYAGYSASNRPLPLVSGFYVLEQGLHEDSVRILSISVDQRFPAGATAADRERQMRDLAHDVRYMLDHTPGLLAIVSAGNERYRGTVANYLQDSRATLLRGALLIVRQELQYRDRIIVVTGTRAGNNFWDFWSQNPVQGSNFYNGVTDLAAPAQDVTVLDRWTGQTGAAVPTAVRTGTSLSAPLVAGVAAQVLAMDSTLTAAQVKALIVRGAQLPRWNPQTGQMDSASVSGAPETVYQLDAYSALKLAAERQGAPLCGNRVWVANQQVIAERDAVLHTSEPLVNLGEPGGGVHVFHGGRRIEVPGQLADRAFELRQGQWVETQDTATTPAGGTYYSMWARSHDLDSTASFRYWTPPDSAAFQVNVYELSTQTETTIDTLVVPTAQFSDFVCIQLDDQGACSGQRPSGAEERLVAELIFPSVGGRLLLAVTYFVTRDVGVGGWHSCAFPDTSGTAVSCRSISYEERTERAELWAVDLTNGTETHLWTFPDRVFWFGASEDGAQLVSGEGVGTTAWSWQDFSDGWDQVWSDPGSVSGCAVRYRSMTDGTEVAPAIATPDACVPFDRGQGTIAPAPPVSSEGR